MKTDIKKQIINTLKTEFSQRQAKRFVSDEIAKSIFGPIPDYSARKSYHILPINTVTVSVFSICIYKGNVVLLKHSDGKLACPGGFIDLEPHILEQPIDAILREFTEEMCDDTGNAVINPQRQRFLPFNTYIDYREFDIDLTPTVNIAYILQMTATEYSKIVNHAKCFLNKKYKEKVQINTNNEVYGVEIIDIARINIGNFAHPNEFFALNELAAIL